MSVPYQIARDNSGATSANYFGRRFTNNGYVILLVANTVYNIPVPTTSKTWLMKCGYGVLNSSIFMTDVGTATVPSGNIASRMQQNPDGMIVNGGATISMITATAGTRLSIHFYAID
jgi:hypothetical protein